MVSACIGKHIDSIDDLKIKRLLQLILSDEESHRSDFQHFVDKAQKEEIKDLRSSYQDRTTYILVHSTEHEYTVVL